MVLVVILIATGVTTLSLVAPFGFLLDLSNDDVAVWRLPHSGHKTIYLTFDDGPNPEVTPPLLGFVETQGNTRNFFS
jgi:peptidoglycan/xylan/chitin deacetylase (PgdA/CDA1 family)